MKTSPVLRRRRPAQRDVGRVEEHVAPRLEAVLHGDEHEPVAHARAQLQLALGRVADGDARGLLPDLGDRAEGVLLLDALRREELDGVLPLAPTISSCNW